MATQTFINNIAAEMPEVEEWKGGRATVMNRFDTVPLITQVFGCDEESVNADIRFTDYFVSAMLLDEKDRPNISLYFPPHSPQYRILEDVSLTDYFISSIGIEDEDALLYIIKRQLYPEGFDAYMDVIASMFVSDPASLEQVLYSNQALTKTLIKWGGIEISDSLGKGKVGAQKLLQILLDTHPTQREQIMHEVNQSRGLQVVNGRSLYQG